MPVTHVQNVGSNFSTASATTLVTTLGASITTTVGNLLVCWGLSGGAEPVSVTDSGGNTWQLDVNKASVDPRVFIYTCRVTSSITTGGTITLTTGSTASRCMTVAEFAGVESTVWFFGQNNNNSTGTAADSAATATLPQADMLVLGAVGHVSTVTSFAFEVLSPTWQAMAAVASTGTVRTLRAGYRLVNDPTAVACKATWTTSRAWSAVVAAEKARLERGREARPGIYPSLLPQ